MLTSSFGSEPVDADEFGSDPRGIAKAPCRTAQFERLRRLKADPKKAATP
jgi:hypothetical protein